MRAYHFIAVAAVILISFGAKMFFLSAPTAEADVHPNIKNLPAAAAPNIARSMEIGAPPYP